VVLITAGMAGVGAAAAGAATGAPAPSLTVRRIDSTAMPAVSMVVAAHGATPALSSFSVTENGKPVHGLATARLSDTTTPVGTVLLLDTGQSMNDANKMTLVRDGAKALVASKGASESMAVVAYGATPRLVQDFTTDPAALNDSIDRLAIGGTPSLYAGVRLASNLLINRSDLLGNMVIVGDGGNSGKLATGTNATADLEASKAVTYAIGLKFGGADVSSLSGFASAGNGAFLVASDAAGVQRAFSAVALDRSDQYLLTYKSALTHGAADLVVTSGTMHAAAQLVPGGIAIGAGTHPAAVSTPQAPTLLQGKAGLLIIALLALVAAGLLAYAVAVLIANEETSLARALRPYRSGSKAEAEAEARAEAEEDEASEGSFISTAFMQKAVETTTRMAKNRGVLDSIETKLEQANLALRPAEALFFYGIAVVVGTALGLVLNGPVMGLIALLAFGLVPPAALSFLAKRRLKKFNSQLPDTLQLLSSSLRAGFSFLQGVEAVAKEVEDPMGSELGRVLVEAQLGRPVEEALDDCALRMKSPDFDWAVMAVRIQREVGGNLAELLQTVSVTMVERERLRRDVKALTAEGRMSAYVLGCLPPALGFFFYVSNPTYMQPLFTQTVGQVALAISVVSMLIGFVWMNKLIQIEV